MQRIQSKFGALDVLVHCAGTHSTGTLEDTPVEQLDALYRTNVRVPFLLTQALLPLLKIQRGQITGPFAATQHALKAITDSLRDEVNTDGVRVLSIHPSRTATPRMEELYEAEGRQYQPELLLQTDDIARVVLTSILLPRTAEITSVELRPVINNFNTYC